MFKIKKMATMCAMVLVLSSVSADDIKPNGCKGPTLCDSHPMIDGCGWHLDVALLLEQMMISNTDISILNSAGDGTVASPTISQEIKNLNFNIDAGLRVGGGKFFKHDDWKFCVGFEWLSSRGALSQDVTNTTNFLIPVAMPTWPGMIVSVSSESALFQELQASLKVDYYLLDATICKGSYFSGKFSFTPLGGLKVSWINYKGNQSYSSSIGPAAFPVSTSAIKTNTTNFWGIGPMVGMHTNYDVCAGWGFFTKFNCSVLVGENRMKERLGTVISTTEPVQYMVTDKITVLCPTLRNTIGVSYNKDIFDNKQHITLLFGFDTRYYFNQYPVFEYNASAKTLNRSTSLNMTQQPNVCENSAFGMVGFMLDLGWAF